MKQFQYDDNNFMHCLFFATATESKNFLKNFQILSVTSVESAQFFWGFATHNPSLSKQHYLIVQTGMGSRLSNKAAQYALAHYKIQEAWIFGLAASTQTTIPAESVLLATEITTLHSDQDISIHADQNLFQSTVALLNKNHISYFEGKIITLSKVIHAAQEKVEIGHKNLCIGLEMEAFAIATQMQKQNIPVQEIRWVLDSAYEALPPFESFVNECGQVRISLIIRTLLGNLRLLFQLPKWAWKTQKTLKKMNCFLRKWLENEK